MSRNGRAANMPLVTRCGNHQSATLHRLIERVFEDALACNGPPDERNTQVEHMGARVNAS
jgi:hypothetical protein